MENYVKIQAKRSPNVNLKVIPGHFVTPNSHVNYYMDMTTMKSRLNEAKAVAVALSQDIISSTVVDTIVCMEGTSVIGAFLADELTKAGIVSMNSHKTIYIVKPEYNHGGQMIFRDNSRMMIENKHLLVLMPSITTGIAGARVVSGLTYYGGKISAIVSIFSAATKVAGYPVHALFTPADLPDYRSYLPDDCELCRMNKKIDAFCNGYGYSLID
ncbi:MAG: orotate phosphoribosyltransferase [Lachnospiraceae bacterium]|nr:orotate phosphoribosyltransferase [Lachnospiraceae bacterium]